MSALALELGGLDDVAERLSRALKEGPLASLRVVPVSPGAAPRRAAAVDGSSALLLQGGAFSVGVYRAGAVVLEGERLVASDIDPPSFALVSEGDLTFEKKRVDAETAAARRALSHLGRGDVLLVDGLIPSGSPIADALSQEVVAKGVALVGVAKRTRRLIDGFPAASVASQAARATGDETFAVPLPPRPGEGASYLARLNAADPWLFRYSFPATESDPLARLAEIATLCGHPAYPGYPSPLAMAHQRVMIDEPEQRELTQALRREAERRGADAAAWDLTFADYHDLLDLGA